MKKHKQMNKKFKLEIPPFGATIWVLVGYKDNFHEVCQKLPVSKYTKKETKGFKSKSEVGGVYYTEGGFPKIIHIVHRNQFTYVHECVHFADEILEYFLVKDKEMKAYYTEWLFKKIKQKLKCIKNQSRLR